MMDSAIKNISPVILEGRSITLEHIIQKYFLGLEKYAESVEI